jgi:predicted O-methyltransferase YrrM
MQDPIIESSYATNNFGDIFYYTVQSRLPQLIVEFGILHGYSTYYLAKGLQANISKQYTGKLISYDLFDQYEYNHGNREEVELLLNTYGLSQFVEIRQGNIFEVCNEFKDLSIDILHVDISNDGDILKKVVEYWDTKLQLQGIILFEGGSEERDNIEWMKKYNKKSIRQEMDTNLIFKSKYIIGTYEKFPSLSVLRKVR